MDFELNSVLFMDARCGNGLSRDEFWHFFLNYSFKSSVWDTFKCVCVFVENFAVRHGNSSKF